MIYIFVIVLSVSNYISSNRKITKVCRDIDSKYCNEVVYNQDTNDYKNKLEYERLLELEKKISRELNYEYL